LTLSKAKSPTETEIMLRKTIFLLIVISLIPSISYAEIKTFTHTIKQPFSGSQSPDDARIAAIAKAKREVLEMAGTYVQSLTVTKNHTADKDEILAISAGVLNAEVVSEDKYLEGNEFGITIVVKVDVDTSDLEERIKLLLSNEELLDKYRKSKAREKELLAKVKELEKLNEKYQSNSAYSNQQEKRDLKKHFQNISQELTALDFDRKAIALFKNTQFSDPKKALEYLNKAIDLDPQYANAYVGRGLSYFQLKDYDRALSDLNKAIELNHSFPDAYNARSIVWNAKGEYNRAIKDCDRAIELNQRYAEAYNNRGLALKKKGEYKSAIESYNKAINLNLNIYQVYCNRGNALFAMKKYNRAIDDFNKAIELNPKIPTAYISRGQSYLMKSSNIFLRNRSRNRDDSRLTEEQKDKNSH